MATVDSGPVLSISPWRFAVNHLLWFQQAARLLHFQGVRIKRIMVVRVLQPCLPTPLRQGPLQWFPWGYF